MLKIRLKRYGRKKQAIYRIIVIDSRKRRNGRALEEVGFYNPLTNETKLNIPQIEKRINNGAKLSNTVKNLLHNIKNI
uniref:ribosomal protein S16 n=1 Tax=Lithothamnion corallioides TaxID=1277934 RepID=UPI0023F43284|nr:ribosomal protein S16 [Lithothamnion corallioides]WEA77083.1 ribosomal protein S16 [Lithothamnion corallioides]